MDELNLKISLLEEEMKFIREQLENLKKPESLSYQQLLAKYQEPQKILEPERKIMHQEKEYTVDSNHFLWDSDGYVCGWLENNSVILSKEHI